MSIWTLMCRGRPGSLVMRCLMMRLRMISQLSAQGCQGTMLLTGTLGGELTRQPMEHSIAAEAVNSRHHWVLF